MNWSICCDRGDDQDRWGITGWFTNGRNDQTLTGGGGNDKLTGAAGNDVLVGGTGNDTYVFGVASTAEADTVTEGTNAGTDTLTFSALKTNVILNLGSTAIKNVHTNRTLKLNATTTFENTIGGSGNDILIGNSLANALTGNAVHNILVGSSGNDQLLGGAGRDILIGGLGLDVLNGGSGDDILIAGRTTSDTATSKLIDLRTEWISGRSYATRIAKIRAGVGSSSASLKAKANVLNDAGEDDSLTGGAGTDWYFRALDDAITDLFASFHSTAELKQRIQDFLAYFNKTFAKPFNWTFTGRPVTTKRDFRPGTWKDGWVAKNSSRKLRPPWPTNSDFQVQRRSAHSINRPQASPAAYFGPKGTTCVCATRFLSSLRDSP